jgi:hypothetical protein
MRDDVDDEYRQMTRWLRDICVQRGDVGAGALAQPELTGGAPKTNFNKRYPHGVGKRFARDRTTGTTPVTTFKRSTLLYNRAMSYNRGLDRDKDGVACEKA